MGGEWEKYSLTGYMPRGERGIHFGRKQRNLKAIQQRVRFPGNGKNLALLKGIAKNKKKDERLRRSEERSRSRGIMPPGNPGRMEGNNAEIWEKGGVEL